VFRDIEMKDPASTMLDDEEAIQDPEGEGRHGEEVHGGDDVPVIAKECSPELARLVPRIEAQKIPGNSAFGDVEAEFEKLTVNPRSTPGCIFPHHPPDESSKRGIDFWPAEAPWARSQTPEQSKASPMPTDNGFRFDNDEDATPCRPKPTQKNPKYAILDSQTRARMFSLEYAQLLS